MRLLEEYIKKYGNALNEDVLKVDAFLNHQIDAQLMMELAKDFKEHFKDKHITKIAKLRQVVSHPQSCSVTCCRFPLSISKRIPPGS